MNVSALYFTYIFALKKKVIFFVNILHKLYKKNTSFVIPKKNKNHRVLRRMFLVCKAIQTVRVPSSPPAPLTCHLKPRHNDKTETNSNSKSFYFVIPVLNRFEVYFIILKVKESVVYILYIFLSLKNIFD